MRIQSQLKKNPLIVDASFSQRDKFEKIQEQIDSTLSSEVLNKRFSEHTEFNDQCGFKTCSNNRNLKYSSKRKVLETNNISNVLKQVPSRTIAPNTKSCKHVCNNYTSDHVRNFTIGSSEKGILMLGWLSTSCLLRQIDSESTGNNTKKIKRKE